MGLGMLFSGERGVAGRLRARFLQRQQGGAERRLPSMARLPVVPTRFGLALCALLVVMFVWSANHQLNLGYALTFLVATLALLAAGLTVAQLSGLQLRLGDAQAVFAGEVARFPLAVQEADGRMRGGMYFAAAGREVWLDGVAAGGQARVWLEMETQPVRGRQFLEAVDVYSTHPLGLFVSWQWLRLEAEVLVYPRPAGDLPLPYVMTAQRGALRAEAAGEDELVGLAPYRVGDSLSRVAWKRTGRGGEQMIKQFAGEGAPEVMLDFALVPGSVEARLSQLCRWILTAEAVGLAYGLRLPGQAFDRAHGAVHRERCLRALALFQG